MLPTCDGRAADVVVRVADDERARAYAPTGEPGDGAMGEATSAPAGRRGTRARAVPGGPSRVRRSRARRPTPAARVPGESGSGAGANRVAPGTARLRAHALGLQGQGGHVQPTAAAHEQPRQERGTLADDTEPLGRIRLELTQIALVTLPPDVGG